MHPSNLLSAIITAVVTMAYGAGYVGLIFAHQSLQAHLSAALAMTFIGCGTLAIVHGLFTKCTGNFAGPDSNAAAVLAVMVSGICQSCSPLQIWPTVCVSLLLAGLTFSCYLFLLQKWGSSDWSHRIPKFLLAGFMLGTGYLLMAGSLNVIAGQSLGIYGLAGLEVLSVHLWLPFALTLTLLAALQRRFSGPISIFVSLGIASLAFYIGIDLDRLDIQTARELHFLYPSIPLQDFSPPLYDINWNRIHTSTILKQFPLFALLLLVSHLSLNLNAKALNNSKNIKPEIRANLIANGLTAPLGGLMGYTSLSRSQLNLNCGATSKLSSILAGTICLGSLVLFPEMISYIPRPILSALIFYMGLQLFLKHLWTQHPSFSLLFNFFTWSVLGIFITLRFIHPSELEQYIPDLDSHHLSKQLERWLDEV